MQGKRIVLGVSGGVAAFKACELTRLLVKAGVEVQVVMTEAAKHFIAPETFQALSGKPVFSDQWDGRIANNMAHIELSRHADAIVVVPASADLLAKTAQGLANDLLSTLILARNPAQCGLLMAPAMNREMWGNPATQRNIATLNADGIELLGPASGDQACGETGDGRMLEAAEILDCIEAHFQPKLLRGKKVLLTAGPTFEAIDPVRGITNLSSGKTGFAIARACWEAGAEVTLVAGPTPLPTPFGVKRIPITSALQMYDAVMAAMPNQHLFIGVAAVADWRVANRSDKKLKKDPSVTGMALEFAENPDILATVSRLANDRLAQEKTKNPQAKLGQPGYAFCVGFAAESEDLAANGSKKRERKACPLLVANIGHATFGKDDNAFLLIDAQGQKELPRADKLMLARQLIAEIANRL